MKHVGKVVTYFIVVINTIFTGILLLTAYSPYIPPAEYPLASCLGLAFPVFLVINGCFFLFWLLIHYKLAWVSLLGFVFCYPQIRTYIPINTQIEEIPKESFLLLSYNVMAFGNMKKVNGKNSVLEYIRQKDADIVCIQEYSSSPPAKKHINNEDIKKAFTAYTYQHIQPIGKNEGSSRIACYSKYPILSHRKIEYESVYNGSAIYEILIGSDTITLINNHLESNKLTHEDKVVYTNMLKDPDASKVKNGMRQLVGKLASASAIRSKQADVIAKEIANTQHRYIVVCGDFNDSPISYTHRKIEENLDDAFVQSGKGLGISYHQNKFYFRIDNILTSQNLKAYNCTVDRSIKESDHYPIWCYISKQN